MGHNSPFSENQVGLWSIEGIRNLRGEGSWRTRLEDYLTPFFGQGKYQHGSSYPILLGVPELNDPTIIVTNLALLPEP